MRKVLLLKTTIKNPVNQIKDFLRIYHSCVYYLRPLIFAFINFTQNM